MYKLLVIWERPWIKKGCRTAAAERGPGRVVIKAAGLRVSLGQFQGTTPAGAGVFRKQPHCKASGVGLRDSRQVTGHHLSPSPLLSQSPTAQPTGFHGNGSLPQGRFGLPARPLRETSDLFSFFFLHSCLFFQALFFMSRCFKVFCYQIPILHFNYWTAFLLSFYLDIQTQYL